MESTTDGNDSINISIIIVHIRHCTGRITGAVQCLRRGNERSRRGVSCLHRPSYMLSEGCNCPCWTGSSAPAPTAGNSIRAAGGRLPRAAAAGARSSNAGTSIAPLPRLATHPAGNLTQSSTSGSADQHELRSIDCGALAPPVTMCDQGHTPTGRRWSAPGSRPVDHNAVAPRSLPPTTKTRHW